MRIQHNISALNAHRQLGNNNNAVAKNLEKLSSGFRINRAGDDAAGLAISEKMRGQIRGLDMASRNANDGISLIQTAEGALNETHSILQRMRELAVQSSNGTYEQGVLNSDRDQLQKETQALKDEIDRIASSTHFNNKKLLDGSLDKAQAAAGAITEGLTGVQDGKTASRGVKAQYQLTVGDDGTALGLGSLTKNIGVGGATVADLSTATLNGAGTAKFSDLFDITIKSSTGTDKTGSAAATVDEGDIITFTAKKEGAQISGANTANDILTTATTAGTDGKAVNTVVGVNEGAGAAATKGNLTFDLDLDKIKGGDTINIGGTTITFTTDQGTANDKTAAGTTAMQIDISAARNEALATTTAKDALLTTIHTALTNALNDNDSNATGASNWANNGSARATGTGKYSINLQSAGAGSAMNAGEVRFSSEAVTNVTNVKAADTAAGTLTQYAKATFKMDLTQLNAGDVLKVGSTQLKLVATGAAAKRGEIGLDTFTADISKKLEEAGFNSGKAVWNNADNSITIEATDFTKTADQLIADIGTVAVGSQSAGGGVTFPTDGITFQIGANGAADQRVSLYIENRDTASLGVDNVDISTDIGANAAIDLIDKATSSVSATRADLGALQNRLEHTISNLGTSVENLTAAESRIRDVDMAKEMMEMTKNNILTQAAQAMLAQANTQPQGVLQLLQ